jgi:transcriptional regulator with GAF, ATPase, and Fis domain
MRELRRKLWNNVFTHDLNLYHRHLWDRMEDFSTLILGETGAGKGTAAASIGRSGFIPFDEQRGTFAESFTAMFAELNLSQFAENLIESELFGHRKGAFTGAVGDYRGAFERCSRHGAIFLDEIGEVSAPIQIKLLRVLQERDFRPVGGLRRLRFEGRVIAATNRALEELREAGRMRDDFFYRLCSDIIVVPPLRQRIQEDAEELDHLLGFVVKRLLGEASEPVAERVRSVIDERLGERYPWPGNVRELEQCVRSTLLNRTYAGLAPSDAPDLAARLAAAMRGGTIDPGTLLAGYCFLQYRMCGTYEETGRRLQLDRRTVKKHVDRWIRTNRV